MTRYKRQSQRNTVLDKGGEPKVFEDISKMKSEIKVKKEFITMKQKR